MRAATGWKGSIKNACPLNRMGMRASILSFPLKGPDMLQFQDESLSGRF